MKYTFAAKTFAAYTNRSATWTGPATVPFCRLDRGAMFQSGAEAGQPFLAGAVKAQQFYSGAEAGTIHD